MVDCPATHCAFAALHEFSQPSLRVPGLALPSHMQHPVWGIDSAVLVTESRRDAASLLGVGRQGGLSPGDLTPPLRRGVTGRYLCLGGRGTVAGVAGWGHPCGRGDKGCMGAWAP